HDDPSCPFRRTCERKPMARRTMGLVGSALLAGAVLGAPTAASAHDSFPLGHYSLSVSSGGGERNASSLTCGGADRQHPDSRQACNDLRDVDGHIDDIPERQQMCTMESNPTTVRAEGFWQGEERTFEAEFANPCVAVAK